MKLLIKPVLLSSLVMTALLLQGCAPEEETPTTQSTTDTTTESTSFNMVVGRSYTMLSGYQIQPLTLNPEIEVSYDPASRVKTAILISGAAKIIQP